MATSPASVVTPQRFASGLSYQEFLAQAKVNKDQFQKWYESFQLQPDDVEFFKRAVAAGATRVLALGEDWCPDVYRGLPVMARIAEAAGMELKVFPRDANLDIMNEFLNQGQFQSIPTFVFYTQKQEYLGHWIERPKLANEERARIEAELKQQYPNATDVEMRAHVRQRTQERFPAWQQATVQELRELLASRLNVR